MNNFKTLPEFKLAQANRTNQRAVIPNFAKNRSLGEIIISLPTLLASTTLSNGDEAIFTISLASATSRDGLIRFFSVPDVSLYLGTVADANQIPSISGTVTNSQWTVIGPWNDWGATNNYNVKTKIYIKNVSAGASKVVLLRSKNRYIANAPTGAT